MYVKKILLLICSFFILNCAQAETSFKDIQDNTVKLNTLKGKWVLVNYWAPWCPSCMHEVPELNKFHEKNQNKNVVLYGVNYDNGSLDELKNSVRKASINFPVLAGDPNQAWSLGEIDAVPTTFIIAPNGKVVKKLVGPTTAAALNATLTSLQRDYA